MFSEIDFQICFVQFEVVLAFYSMFRLYNYYRILTFYNVDYKLKALSHDIRDLFRTLRAGRSFHAPLIEKVDWNEAWAAVERANNFTQPGAITTRDVHIVTLAQYDATTAIALYRDKEPAAHRLV